MKKDVFYFVHDAYGYLVSTDEVGFYDTVSIWKSNDCKYDIIKEEKDSYIVIKLFRV